MANIAFYLYLVHMIFFTNDTVFLLPHSAIQARKIKPLFLPMKLISNKITNFKSKMEVFCNVVDYKGFYIA